MLQRGRYQSCHRLHRYALNQCSGTPTFDAASWVTTKWMLLLILLTTWATDGKQFEVFHHNVQQWRDLQGTDTTELPAFFSRNQTRLIGCAESKFSRRFRTTLTMLFRQQLVCLLELGRAWSEISTKGSRESLKGITVYVDGSRSGMQAVTKDDTATNEEASPSIVH